ncbi:hypothetical protein D8674_035601 [Pyrus ussuriensis x Pyrus communis]|uniref:RNase H type-1 domain-containing protein n=1 Tax=Pyrus ussuriensis x Pyrus communis TaxID=2448454 RepID=A0A5N5GCU5_9ROSA|nr:hypothetical protein D8674_035601 [Pyrus ussuriensis x Pyrus communis]
MANDYNNANKRGNKEKLIRWIPSGDDVFKLNFDGSVKNNGAAGGFVIQDECGDPVLAGARSLGEVSINVVECLALRDALWMAISRGLQKIMVEGDSKLIIEAVQGTSSVLWRVKTIIDDIKLIAGSFDLISWNHVYQKANFVVNVVTDVGF